MHQYLKAIGFDGIRTRKQLKEILKEVETVFTHQTIVSYNEEADYCEFQKEYAKNAGIFLCGELDEREKFEADYYFPYFTGEGVTSDAEITVERKIENESYIGVCEDEKVGISLIFYLQNGIDYMKECQLGFVMQKGMTVTFSGLANSGKILFPVMKNVVTEATRAAEQKTRKQLLSAARNGDQAAIETLTLDDIDIYSKVSRRLISEDVFSIVDTYIMPYGVECDQYSILGEILEVHKAINRLTGVELYQLKVDVNELIFDVCVPVKEVLGEPDIGRRFKATIWLQGYLNF